MTADITKMQQEIESLNRDLEKAYVKIDALWRLIDVIRYDVINYDFTDKEKLIDNLIVKSKLTR